MLTYIKKHKIVRKGTNPSVDASLQSKNLSRISKSKNGHNYAKKQIRVMGLVPIILDNHREQVCEVSIDSLQ
jgi:hypothetical protein